MAARLLLRSSTVPRVSAAASSASCSRAIHTTAVRAKDPQLGDYPELPEESLQKRKWSPRYWDTQDKRNFGETLHEQDDTMSVWAPDLHPISGPSALRQLGIAALVALTFAGVVYITKPDPVSFPKTFPRDGLKGEMGGNYQAFPNGAFDATEGEGDSEDSGEEEE